MKCKCFNFRSVLVIGVVALMVLSFAVVYAENSVEPSAANNVTWKGNYTSAYPNGTLLNYTRGYIHEINIEESAPTLKWIGFVGNVSGKFALQDSAGYALYDWTIGTTRGEIYATKEGPCPECDTGAGTLDHSDEGGVPVWESIRCANPANMTQEQALFNHTRTYGAKADEDSYMLTFKNTSFTLREPFYVGEEVEIGIDDCYGVNLYQNGSSKSAEWEEVVLMDGSVETEGSGGFADTQWDIIYAVVIQNNTPGFRNGTYYDFQILLPQSGLEGSNVPNIPYYFYVELI